jgi:proline iminopeptidase
VKAAPVNATRKQLLKYPLLKNNPTPNFKITVTYGASDIYGDSKKYVRERYPTATFINIENCGHLPWLHNSPAFSKILEEHF